MDDKTQEQVGVFLKMVNESLQSGKDFVLEQAPLVVQEIVTFGRVYHTTLFSLGLFGILLTVVVILVVWREAKGTPDPDFVRGMSVLIGSAPVSFSMILSGTAMSSMLQAWFAPRLYVLSQVGDMLK